MPVDIDKIDELRKTYARSIGRDYCSYNRFAHDVAEVTGRSITFLDIPCCEASQQKVRVRTIDILYEYAIKKGFEGDWEFYKRPEVERVKVSKLEEGSEE